MKDVTSTSFGLIIAYIIPGLTFLWGLSLANEKLKSVFSTVMTIQSNAGLFLLIILASIAVSLLISPLRYLIFERYLCKSKKIDRSHYAFLDENNYSSFHALIDYHYRYHQFWGGMLIAMVVPCAALVISNYNDLPWWAIIAIVTCFLLLEWMTIYAAKVAFESYVDKTNQVLGRRVENAKRYQPE